MWAEARKQEKKIRGIMVDHKKRAERRREYYEKIKQDPAQFLQISGRSCKLHIDHNAIGPEPPNVMMPWQGNAEISIDRFDVRAHLDYIADVQIEENTYPEESKEMRPLNYERYRILIQNGFLKIKEERFLKTLALEEKYGGKTYQTQKAEDDKKKLEKSKAAIGFTYEDSTPTETPQQSSASGSAPGAANTQTENPEQSESDDDFDDLDTVINFSALSRDQQYDLNSIGRSYFLGREDFIKYLQHEADEQENAKTAKAEEEEKSAFSGRKSRKERRILKEKRLAGRVPSPPSYATYEQGDKKHKKSMDHSTSEESSRSASPVDRRAVGKVEYISTFGEEKSKRNSSKDKKSKKRSKRDRSSSSSSSSDDGRSGGKYRSKYRRKRRSSSSSSEAETGNGKSTAAEAPPPPPVKRYYGRKRTETDEEKLTEDEDGPATEFSKSECSNYQQLYTREASNDSSERGLMPATISNHHRSSVNSAVISSRPGTVQTLKEKLKKRMQSQLQKHYKADKRAEIDRKIRAEEARLNREDELKEMMRKVKAKRDSGDNSSSESPESATEDPKKSSRHRRSRRRSRSCSSSSRSSTDRRHTRRRRRTRSRSNSRSRSHRR